MPNLKSNSKAVPIDVPINVYLVQGYDWREASITQTIASGGAGGAGSLWIAGFQYVCKSASLKFNTMSESNEGSGDPVVRRRAYRRSGSASITALQHLYSTDSQSGLDQLFGFAQAGLGIMGIQVVINGNSYMFMGGVAKTSKSLGNPVTTDIELENVGFAAGVPV